jgi:hypothetical protein
MLLIYGVLIYQSIYIYIYIITIIIAFYKFKYKTYPNGPLRPEEKAYLF